MWTLCFICSWIIPVALPASLWVKVFRSGEWFCPWDCAPELRVESRVFPLYRQLCPSKAGPGAGQGQVESPESACARGGVWGGVSSGPAPSFTVESWSVVWPLDSRHISVWDLCVCPEADQPERGSPLLDFCLWGLISWLFEGLEDVRSP